MNNYPLQTNRNHTWAFQSCPPPWNLIPTSETLYESTIAHVGTQYVPVLSAIRVSLSVRE